MRVTTSRIATLARNILIRAISVPRLVRAAAHVAAWIPFLVSAASSWLSDWRVIGDGAMIALGSWATFTHLPLVGLPNEFPGSPHDLGPAEYWLLAIPVHVDPARGVLWGAALLCMIAASLAIEAAWSVAGELGAVAASAVILGIAAWMPGLVLKPYWNPYFGAMFFLAALAACWAVMSGHRRWWPVLVIAASVAAQAHLMFALASAAITLAALITGLADAVRARAGCRWAVTGLAAGLACWIAPLDQQLTNRPGNMSLLLRAEAAGHHADLGLTFAMKTLAAFTMPPPLWLRLHLGQRQHIDRLLEARPAGFAAAILVITAATFLIAAFGLRSRRLASLAAVSLLVSATAAITISRIPSAPGDRVRLEYMIIAMYPAGVLIWLTVASAVAAAARQISGLQPAANADAAQPAEGRHRTAQYLTRLNARYGRAAVVPLLLLASLPALAQQPARPAPGQNAYQVGVAAALIERTLPGRPAITLSVSAGKPDRYQVRQGLLWALTGDGYPVDCTWRGRTRSIPHVTVLVHGGKMTVQIRKIAANNLVATVHPGEPASPGSRGGESACL